MKDDNGGPVWKVITFLCGGRHGRHGLLVISLCLVVSPLRLRFLHYVFMMQS